MSKGRIVMLSTAQILIQSGGLEIKARVLLDNASVTNVITEKLCNILCLKRHKSEACISGIGAFDTHLSEAVNLKIKSKYGGFEELISCRVIKTITSRIPDISCDPKLLNIPDEYVLADENFFKSDECDLLLGADMYWKILLPHSERLKNGLVVQNTKLGYIVGGSVSSDCKKLHQKEQSYCALENSVKRFFAAEECDVVKTNVSTEERKCEDIFKETLNRNEEGRFIIKLPFKETIESLGESKHASKMQLVKLERRLENNVVLKSSYIKFMRDFEKAGFMTEIKDIPEKHCFLNYHAVTKNSEPNKVRIVFHANEKTSTGIALNDVIMQGPKLQNDIFGILLRFRTATYVLTADIVKMYLQILLHEDQRKFQLIMWRESSDEKIRIFQLNTLTFGINVAPYIAIRCIRELAENYKEKYPEAASAILKNSFYDDFVIGKNDINQLQKVKAELIEVLGDGGFELQKFHSNVSSIVEDDKERKSEQIVLGTKWDIENDYVSLQIPVCETKGKITKRGVLKFVASFFDIYGLIAPYVLKLKLFLRNLFAIKINWDEELPERLIEDWITIIENVELLKNIKIPRCAINENSKSNIQLIGFSDASGVAYAAVLYIKIIEENGNEKLNFLCAKTRVAPVKNKITIPKLELCAMMLLAKLYDKVKNELELKIDKITFYSDSKVCLSWLLSKNTKLECFVTNRLKIIKELTSIKDWKFVPTKLNAADIASRGCNVLTLIKKTNWLEIPYEILKESSEVNMNSEENANDQLYTTEEIVLSSTEKKQNFLHDLIEKISSPKKLLRIISYCLRFLRGVRGKEREISLNITKAELENAHVYVIKTVQTDLPIDIKESVKHKDKKHKYLNLDPFVDDDGIIRVGGRLKNADLPYDNIHPIILPRTLFAKNVARELHEKHLHCGAQSLLAIIRQNYWPLRGIDLVKQTTRNCVICFKANPKEIMYKMGNLPKDRITPAPPFYRTSLDYMGPIMIKDKKGRHGKLTKAYVCVFVCQVTKAIHLEIVGDLTAVGFLAALRRFSARRGIPGVILSDNGRNFVAARNNLKELGKFLQNDAEMTRIQKELLNESIEWKLLPPRAPFMGGLHEAGVKSVKYYLKRLISNEKLIYEELLTVLTQIECMLNSRPLYPISDPENLTVLTPGHFLVGRPLNSIVDAAQLEPKAQGLKTYKHLRTLTQTFWKQWSSQYLQSLQTRVKWQRPGNAHKLKQGDVVVVKEDNLLPGQWMLGKIVDLYKGADGVARVAKIKVRNTFYERPTKKLCPLPKEEDEEETSAIREK